MDLFGFFPKLTVRKVCGILSGILKGEQAKIVFIHKEWSEENACKH